MRLSLRWKILFLTVLTPLTLAVATLATVRRDVNEHVNSSSIHESLEHSVSVFEGMLATRTRVLAGGGHVIAQDPRFFSLLMLGTGQRDSRFVATVKGMARDFNRITLTDLFEVVDRRGRVLASVGASHSTAGARADFVHAALRGRMVEGILVEPGGSHFQVAATPVVADGQTVGVLLLGAEIGSDLANELHQQMRCEVTFLSHGRVTGTTLVDPQDRAALLAELARLELHASTELRRYGVLRVRGRQSVYLTLVRGIPGAAPGDLQLYVMQRSFDPESSFQHIMQNDMLMLEALALIMAIVTGWLFSGQILGPLHRLVRGAREMEKGNYDQPLDVRRRDELGYLAEQFARMRQRERAYVSSLEQAARLKSEFISIASHELRTPISVLSGYRDLLADGELGAVTPKQAQALESMHEYLGRLTRVAEDATRVAQLQGERLAIDPQPREVEPVVRRAVGAAIAAGTGRDVRVEARVEAFDGPVIMDGEMIAQAITHLVTNGIRFTPDGGRVDVVARREDGRLVLTVSDTGVGIAAEELAALLSHGVAANEAKHHQTAVGLAFNSPGLGMGLSIVRGIVEAHGGRLHAESAPGRGSTFTIELPLDAARRAA